MLRLGVDFGSSGTVIAGFDTATGAVTGRPLYFETCVKCLDDDGPDGRTDACSYDALMPDRTVRHLRHHILRNSPHLIPTGNGPLTCREAGKDYLVNCIRTAMAGNTPAQEIVFSLPEQAPSHYTEWIASVAEKAGFAAYRTVDEITAASTGYGIVIPDDHAVMVIDSGADAFTVTIGCPVRGHGGSVVSFRSIGHAAADAGGRIIDAWLADRYLPGRYRDGRGNARQESKNPLQERFRKAKETLSSGETASLSVPCNTTWTSSEKEIAITRNDLENLLAERGYYDTIHRTIDKALSGARFRGCDAGRISHVLMVGGGSQIPSVQDCIGDRFGPERVLCDHPGEVIARGAARCQNDDRSRMVPRDYALRYWDPASRQHEYRYIVRKGTPYPTGREVSRILVTASYDGQTCLGLALYALGSDEVSDTLRDLELVSDPNGSLRRLEHTEHDPSPVAEWINERSPTLLTATPPALKGEVRFELTFRVDGAGHLRVTARDVQSGTFVFEDHSMANLA
jgi:molecular chaperone DnaK (HSP70)